MFESDAAAAEALAAANTGEVAAPEVASEQAPVQTEAQNTVDAGTNQTSESFTTIDINSLPEEIRPLAEQSLKNLQADYTRKTQEIAPVRQIMSETGMSADEARQALEFFQGLDNPDNLRQLYDHLSSQFGNETAQGEEEPGYEVDPRDRQIEELTSRLDTWEQQQAMTQAKQDLHEVEQAIRTENPSYKDADIERIQKLAVVHMQNGADVKKAMGAAATEFKSWRDDVLSSYVDGKGQVQTNGTPLVETSHAQTPSKFGNLDEATKAALSRFGADWAN